MNQRLRELMIEAGYAAPELAGRANELAELIVQECIRIVRKNTASPEGVQALMKHFGVEE